MRILVVDDEPKIVRLVEAFLEQTEHKVVTATSAAQSLEIIQEQEGFDLLIVDLNMPHMTGLELYQTLVEQDHPLHKRFVIMTGWIRTNLIRETVPAIGFPVLYKPVSKNSLESVIAYMSSQGLAEDRKGKVAQDRVQLEPLSTSN